MEILSIEEQELLRRIEQYKSLYLENAIDYEKFSMISIVWHSTKIEGCSLTETDTKVLLEKGLTASGKPLKDHLMVKDHYTAFQFIKEQAKLKKKILIPFIQEINSLIMKNTGGIVQTAIGSFDTSKGDIRLVQVYVDKKYFPNYQKAPQLLEELCYSVNERIEKAHDIEIIRLSADIHYQFVNIHPFGDGNGRTARLLMNYIQFYHDLPPIKIFSEDRSDYIDALNEIEEKKDIEIFRKFIYSQMMKFLNEEITKFQSIT